jgi:2,3-bisphosphoglycerate-independent phosphoglycerate mutase
MKYVIIVPDGAADRPEKGEAGKTPLEEAHMPVINGLAAHGEIGLVRTIPDGISPGSDAANLAVMGYDPKTDLTGRSPLEAVSMGIDLADTDVSFRTNLVTLDPNGKTVYEDFTIVDHSSGDITNEEARVLIEYVDEILGSGDLGNGGRVRFYPGVSYRHALIVKEGAETASGVGDVFKELNDYDLTPPHDVLERRIGEYLPKGEGSAFLYALMKKSYDLLTDHPVNKDREARGLNPANSLWIWGQGKRPSLASFGSKFGITGSVVSAVDLIKGIGICAGLESIDVEGATGTLKTNFKGKADAVIAALDGGKDFVYVHLEAPDECSHQGNRAEKIEALERIDAEVAAPIVSYLKNSGEDYRVLVVPDHRTPLEIRTHSDEPVPYVLYDSAKDAKNENNAFTELSGAQGKYFDSGCALSEYFFGSLNH